MAVPHTNTPPEERFDLSDGRPLVGRNFPISFPVLNRELTVAVITDDDIEHPLSTGWTFTNGTIIFFSEPSVQGELAVLLVRRPTENIQNYELTPGGDDLNNQLDRTTLTTQDN